MIGLKSVFLTLKPMLLNHSLYYSTSVLLTFSCRYLINTLWIDGYYIISRPNSCRIRGSYYWELTTQRIVMKTSIFEECEVSLRRRPLKIRHPSVPLSWWTLFPPRPGESPYSAWKCSPFGAPQTSHRYTHGDMLYGLSMALFLHFKF